MKRIGILLVIFANSIFAQNYCTLQLLPSAFTKELSPEDIAARAADLLGLKYDFYEVTSHPQKYAKITPIDDDERKSFMHWATVTHNVYSLGRFATWRPNLLLDDLINDIRKIDKWIGSTNKYDTARDR
jgi:hypothetical protein